MTTRLRLYNTALTLCGEEHIASITEDRKSRRLLDHVWDNGGVKSCLEDGQWNFCTRTIEIYSDPSITLDFGYSYAFEKPADWVATCALSADEYFTDPLTAYSEESGYWYADSEPLYVKYVSNDSTYGGDLSTWPESFTDFAAAHFASKIILSLTSDKARSEGVELLRKNLLKAAKNHDAMGSPTRFPPQGSWSSSRQRTSHRDRGKRGNLIG